MRKNRKITRNSYKRKIILFGIILFISIALISTGFTVWVMSTGAKEETEGGVEIGVVADANITISDLKIYKEVIKKVVDKETNVSKDVKELAEVALNKFVFDFEPLASDTTGRVRYNEGGAVESLVLVINAFVTPKDYISKVTIKLEVPQGVIDAAQQGYITLPECATIMGGELCVELKEGDNELLAETTKNSRGEDVPTGRLILNYRIEFGWGEKFGGMNPGLYFDVHPDGLATANQDVKEQLEKFRALVYGYEYDPEATDEELLAHASPLYKLTITANIN
jgi:hypothetical protein